MEGKSPAKRGTPWSLILFGALAVYAILIALLNKREVPIRFVFFTTTISLVVLIVLCLGIGFASGFLFDGWRQHRKRKASEK